MKTRLLRNKDFWAGMMLVVIGAAAMFVSREYRFVEVLPLTAALVVGAAPLFIWGLGLPCPLLKGF